MKKKYQAITKNGEILNRQTDRVYTHAVILIRANGSAASANWCGSLELANKKSRSSEFDRALKNGCILEIIEVTQVK